jgi:hypothetical protein
MWIQMERLVYFRAGIGSIRREELAHIATALYRLASNDDERRGIEAIAIACGLELKECHNEISQNME